MTAFKSDFLNVLQERGFIHQISDPDSLDALAAKGEAVGYIGFDCTAPSLHVGNLIQIMMLYWLQQTGAGKPIALMGGGTTDAIMPDNAEWLTRLNYIDMLRDVGRHLSVNRMLTMDSIRQRLERQQ